MTGKSGKRIILILGIVVIAAAAGLTGYKVWSPREITDTPVVKETRTTKRYEELGQIAYEHAEPGVYHQGSSDYINGEPAWNAGKFITWSELGKRGIMIVRQGKLSTPMDFSSEESDFCNYLAVEYIDGMIVLPDHITSIAKGTFFHCNITGICLPESLEHIGAGAFAQCHLFPRRQSEDVQASLHHPSAPARLLDIQRMSVKQGPKRSVDQIPRCSAAGYLTYSASR